MGGISTGEEEAAKTFENLRFLKKKHFCWSVLDPTNYKPYRKNLTGKSQVLAFGQYSLAKIPIRARKINKSPSWVEKKFLSYSSILNCLWRQRKEKSGLSRMIKAIFQRSRRDSSVLTNLTQFLPPANESKIFKSEGEMPGMKDKCSSRIENTHAEHEHLLYFFKMKTWTNN